MPIKRESEIAFRQFPFELLHTEGPANNMRIFHWHDFMELSFVRAGRGTYEIEGRTYRVGPGDIVVINNTERHRVTYRHEEPLHETVMHLAPELLCPREGGDLDARYLRLVCGIVREWREKRPWFELMIKSQLLTLVTLLLREAGPPEAPDLRRAALRRRTSPGWRRSWPTSATLSPGRFDLPTWPDVSLIRAIICRRRQVRPYSSDSRGFGVSTIPVARRLIR